MKKKIKPLDVWLLSAGVVIISFILPLRTVFSNIKTTKKKKKKPTTQNSWGISWLRKMVIPYGSLLQRVSRSCLLQLIV